MPLYSLKCWTRDSDGRDLTDNWQLESEWTIEANGDAVPAALSSALLPRPSEGAAPDLLVDDVGHFSPA